MLGGCFLVGLLLVRIVVPRPPEGCPDWVAARQKTMIRGTILSAKPVSGDRMTYVANRITGPEGPLPGKLAWTVRHPEVPFFPGQTFSARLDLRPAHGLANFGLRDGTWYWTRQGVFWRAYSRGGRSGIRLHPSPVSTWAVRRWKLRNEVLQAVQPGPGQGLLLGLLLGDRSRIDHDLMRRVRRAGLAHSLALSGLHLGFVALLGQGAALGAGMLFPALLLRMPRPRLGVVLAAPLMLGYMWLGGWTPSLVRSGLMFASWGVLLLRGRPRVLLDGLFLAVLLMLLFDPLCVYDTGLQLSVLAVAGIGIGLGPVRHLTAGIPSGPVRNGLHVLGLPVLAGMLATAAALPVLTWRFGMVSPHFWLNALWLPVLGMVVLPLGLAGLVSAMIPGLQGLGWAGMQAAGAVLDGFAGCMAFLEGNGWLDPTLLLRPGWLLWFGYWTILFALVRGWAGGNGRNARRDELTALGIGLTLLCLALLGQAGREESERVVLTVLDTGMSQGVVLELPGDRRVLVDGGGSWRREYDMGESVVSPALAWNHPPGRVGMVLTHGDTDHYRGLLHPLAWSPVREFVHNGFWPGGWGGDELVGLLRNRNVPVRRVHAGEVIDLGAGCGLEVLHPPRDRSFRERNNRSLVLRLVRNGHGLALIPGDVERKGIEALLAAGEDLSADVLVLPHHGSRGSLAPELYRAVRPRLAVAAAGLLNRFGFPHQEVRTRCLGLGIPVLSTGEEGAIRVSWTPNGRMSPATRRP
jgi:competence protein ComEC